MKCHNAMPSGERKVKHAPFAKGDCAKCHDPHQSDERKLLAAPSPKLCLKCHKPQKEELKMANVHPPFENNCLNCHSPHSSNEAKMLNLTPQNLCLYCHDDMQKKMASSSTVHGALSDKRSCLNCHSPHASPEKAFLVADTKTLCLKCHSKTIALASGRKIGNIDQTLSKSKTIHGAIEKVGCTGCHDPHATNHPNLLKAAFPSGSYATANKENFALCFKCHKGEIIEKSVSTVTGFRNGDKNLHYLHVNGEKGRNCTICHNAHGSPNEHLINELAPFGSWDMPLNFKKLDAGGSCAPGCHSEKKYERVISVGKS
jgi:predicted CXXCH cytochrome family protein